MEVNKKVGNIHKLIQKIETGAKSDIVKSTPPKTMVQTLITGFEVKSDCLVKKKTTTKLNKVIQSAGLENFNVEKGKRGKILKLEKSRICLIIVVKIK